MRRMLAEGVSPDGQQDPEALADALRRVGRLARQPGLVVMNSVLALEILDPRETALPAVGHLALVDPETGARLEVNTSSRRVRERFAELERERQETVARELRRLRVHHVALTTDNDWLRELGRRLR